MSNIVTLDATQYNVAAVTVYQTDRAVVCEMPDPTLHD